MSNQDWKLKEPRIKEFLNWDYTRPGSHQQTHTLR